MAQKDSRKETELVDAARGGDSKALDQLITRHQARIYRFGMKMCRDPEDAKDVLQETLMSLARSVRTFRGTSALSTWLYRVARSHCTKARRRSKFAPDRDESLDTELSPESEALRDPGADPEQAAAAKQLEAAIERGIRSLEPSYREVLVLRDIEGLEAREVGEVLELSVAAVKSRLHRARKQLREYVQPLLAPEPESGPDCPDVVTLLSEHLEGQLEPAVCDRMERHVDSCSACSARCAALRKALALCKASSEETVPPEVAKAVRDAVDELRGR